jgi:hypothetical protein
VQPTPKDIDTKHFVLADRDSDLLMFVVTAVIMPDINDDDKPLIHWYVEMPGLSPAAVTGEAELHPETGAVGLPIAIIREYIRHHLIHGR